MNSSIKNNVPKEPGIYKFINKNKKIIYVGKSKNLNSKLLLNAGQ